MAETSSESKRLITLLHKIRVGLQKSWDRFEQASDKSEWSPHFDVCTDDITVAALMLRDAGLPYDGLRLKRRLDQLRNRCVGELLAGMAEDESQEYRDNLIELFGPFPSQTNLDDPVVSDRMLSIANKVLQMVKLLDDLIGSVMAGDDGKPNGNSKSSNAGRKPFAEPIDARTCDAILNDGRKHVGKERIADAELGQYAMEQCELPDIVTEGIKDLNQEVEKVGKRIKRAAKSPKN